MKSVTIVLLGLLTGCTGITPGYVVECPMVNLTGANVCRWVPGPNYVPTPGQAPAPIVEASR